MSDAPKSSPILWLDSDLPKKELEKIRDNFSAIVLHENRLWLGGDEGTSIDLMSRNAAGDFGSHQRFDLQPLLKLPDEAEGEIDIEGLYVDGEYLWLVGSHSLKRKKPEGKKAAYVDVFHLSDIAADGNRFTLGRVPLHNVSENIMPTSALTAARLKGNSEGNLLTESLRDDRHIGPFVPRPSNGRMAGIPSKDNGLDVEGLAVSGNRIFLGLRGPVLRGWAILLELQVAKPSDGLFELEPLEPCGDLYRKHFLYLDGLGARDLAIHNNKDLYILAGPTMDLDGPVLIYRWRNALEQKSCSLTWLQDSERVTGLERVVSLPFGVGANHAEGITLIDDPLSVLVCYDSPSDDRIVDVNGVKVDIFSLPR